MRYLPASYNIKVEVGEGISRRTDGHVGELQFRDWQSLKCCGDWTVGPAREGLLDQDKGSSEASDDDTDPEQSDQPSVSSYIEQTMDGGGLQELLHSLQDLIEIFRLSRHHLLTVAPLSMIRHGRHEGGESLEKTKWCF